MANGFQRTRSLSDMYVYYEHLNKTYPNLYSKLKNDLNNTAFGLGSQGKVKNSFQATASKLRAMSNIELQKERNFIKSSFGKDIPFEIKDDDDFRKFIDTFNSFMQVKEVYEANKTLILSQTKSSKGSEVTNKNAYTYFSEYFARAFKDRIPRIAEKVVKILENSNLKKPLEEIIEEVIAKEVPRAVEKALNKLEKVGGLSKVKNIEGYTEQEDETVIAGYRKIAEAINNLGKQSFGQLVIRELGLNNLTKYVASEIKEAQLEKNFDIDKLRKAMHKGAKYYSSSQGKNILGGNMLELVENAVINEVAKMKGSNFYAIQTGGTLAKPDNVTVSTTISIQEMEKIWDKAFKEAEEKAVSRKRNIEAAEHFRQTLEQTGGTGYILYSSAKNQTFQSNNFKYGGFNSGVPMGIDELQTVMEKVPGGEGKGLARAVMQTLGGAQGGALGHDQLGRLQSEIASYLAYFLFDDFTTIGTDIANDSKNSINCLHAMYLNGVYVPMSVLLNLLAQAFETESQKGVESVSKVVISRKNIKYDYENDPPSPEENPWQQQRDEALREMNVTVRFLRSFKDIMASLKT